MKPPRPTDRSVTYFRMRRVRGFSLLEVMLAVALSAMLLVAVNFFVLSMGELWSGGSESRLFDRHVRGVTRFLESLVNQSVVLEQSPSTGSTASVGQRRSPAGIRRAARGGLVRVDAGGAGRRGLAVSHGAGVGWSWGLMLAQALPGQDQGGRGRLPPGVRDAGPDGLPQTAGPDGPRGAAPATANAAAATGPRFRFGTPHGYDGLPPMLMFEVDAAPGQCVWPGRALPRVECALQVNAEEGLVLLWKSKLEDDYGEARPRKTRLSPFASMLSFDYYDAENSAWQHAEQPLADGQGGWQVPQRIRIVFTYQGRTREVSVALPDTPGGAPLR